MRLTLTVKSNAKEIRVERVSDTELKVWVKAPAREGKANDAVVHAVAEYLGVAHSRVRVVKGQKSKKKLLEVFEDSR